MRIGILGTGDVGKALGRAFLAEGHEVMLAAREASNPKATEWASSAGPKASAGSFADAATFGEIVVIATKGMAAENAIALASPSALEGKIVIDTTNPLGASTGGPSLAIGHTDSMGERVQRAAPGAKVVKAFNTVGNAYMYKPSFAGGPPDMFICGNDEGAKTTVSGILTAFGWGVCDIGGIEGSRLLEPLCLLWVVYGMKRGAWDHAFKMLRK